QPLHQPQRLVPAGGRPDRQHRGGQARRPRRAQRGLLLHTERGPEKAALGADDRRRRGGVQRRRAALARRRRRPAPRLRAPMPITPDEWREGAERLRRFGARLAASSRRRRLRAGENPLLDLVGDLAAGEPWRLSPGLARMLDLAERRRELASMYSWAIPTE